MTRYEMETEVLFNKEESTATLYTADPSWINKLDKLVEQNGTDFKLAEEVTHGGKVIAKTYEFPKRFVSIRSKDRVSNMTDEQKAAAAERLAKLRKSKEDVLNDNCEPK